VGLMLRDASQLYAATLLSMRNRLRFKLTGNPSTRTVLRRLLVPDGCGFRRPGFATSRGIHCGGEGPHLGPRWISRGFQLLISECAGEDLFVGIVDLVRGVIHGFHPHAPQRPPLQSYHMPQRPTRERTAPTYQHCLDHTVKRGATNRTLTLQCVNLSPGNCHLDDLRSRGNRRHRPL
jgi:hypothetical protein